MITDLLKNLKSNENTRMLLLQESRLLRTKADMLKARWYETVNTFLAEHPKYLRALRGKLTQWQVAAMCDTNAGSVSLLESGRTDRISDEKLLQMLRVYANMEGTADGIERSSGASAPRFETHDEGSGSGESGGFGGLESSSDVR